MVLGAVAVTWLSSYVFQLVLTKQAIRSTRLDVNGIMGGLVTSALDPISASFL